VDIRIIKCLLKKGVWQGYWKLFPEILDGGEGVDLGRLCSGSSIFRNFLRIFLQMEKGFLSFLRTLPMCA
jgi:hypothetical protein